MKTVKELTMSQRIILWLAKSSGNTKCSLANELDISRPTLDRMIKNDDWDIRFKVVLDRLGL